MNQSIATVDTIDFINLQPLEINPLMSECEIKVLYVGQNRNHSYISRDVAIDMSKTLRGCPIVGYWKSEKQDFADHGERVVLDDQGMHFECLTKPYGFVAPDAKVWFQKFEQRDERNRPVIRQYLMTTGYLWTGQFKQCQRVIDNGNNQSMQLDGDTLSGQWATKNGLEFFIINDATFSKLCILGEDVEPCFEGASVTKPDISLGFSAVDNGFKHTLFSMMQDLKEALKGGITMDEQIKEPVIENKEPETEFAAQEQPAAVEDVAPTEFKKDEQKKDAPADDEKKEEAPADQKKGAAPSEQKKDAAPADDEQDKKKKAKKQEDYSCGDAEKKKYELLEANFNALQQKYNTLEAKCNELLEFKQSVDDAKKDELINSFYMLSDEDKQDVIANKSKYSYDDIEAKLSVICVRKRVSFNDNDNSSKEPIVTFNLNDNQTDSVPAWIKAMENTQKSRK